jgi:hypothetical protein
MAAWSREGTPVTTREVLAVLLRRWPFVLLGLALSLAAGYQATRQEVVHWTRFSVVALPPVEPIYPNTLEDGQYDIVPLVGLTVTLYNEAKYPQQMSTADTTIYGEGMRSAEVARLFNAGSQWIQVHDRPVVDVQVVDSDPERVLERSERIVADLSQILEETQRDIGVEPRRRVSFITSPDVPQVRPIGGSPSRAALATSLAGGIATIVLVTLGDWAWGRRRHRHGSTAPAGPGPDGAGSDGAGSDDFDDRSGSDDSEGSGGASSRRRRIPQGSIRSV